MYEEVHRIGLLHCKGEGGGILLLSAASIGKAEQAWGVGVRYRENVFTRWEADVGPRGVPEPPLLEVLKLMSDMVYSDLLSAELNSLILDESG